MADAPIIPVSMLIVGGYLAWFGVHYFGTDVKYPTDPVKAILTGGTIPAASGKAPSAHVTLASDVMSLQPDQQNQQSQQSGTDINHKAGAYTITDLQQLWTANGGHSSTAFIAANVAMAESSGDANATSKNPDGGTNVGLWQLDTRGVGAGYTVEQLKDPGTNARITVMNTANGTAWSQWADAVVQGGRYIGPTSEATTNISTRPA